MFNRICEAYARGLTVVMAALGVSLLGAVAIQVAGRYIPFVPPYLWPLEVTNFSLIWMIFIGSILGVRDEKHFFVDVFLGKSVNPAVDLSLKIIYYVVMAVVTYIFIYYGYRYFVRWGTIQTSDITGINLGFLYISVPIAGLSWLLFLIESVLKLGRSRKKGGESS